MRGRHDEASQPSLRIATSTLAAVSLVGLVAATPRAAADEAAAGWDARPAAPALVRVLEGAGTDL